MKTSPPTLVLLDTSFILSLLKGRRDLADEIRRAIPRPVRIATSEGVVAELQRLSRKAGSATAGLAKAALESLEARRIEVMETNPAIPEVDTSILATALANRHEVIVATVDGQLRGLLARHRIAAILPVGKKRLMVSGGGPVPLK